MKEDELNAHLKAAQKQLEKHVEVINTLNKNQQVIVKKLEEFEKSAEINKRVKEIVQQTQAATKAADKKEEPAKAEPEKKKEPAKAEPAKEEPAKTEPEKKEE